MSTSENTRLDQLAYCEIPAGEHTLGWRTPSDPVVTAVSSELPLAEFRKQFSPSRSVSLKPFQIATTPIAVEYLITQDDLAERFEQNQKQETVDNLCDAIDEILMQDRLRLPTEDEFEAACGDGMFFWGETVPDGVPHLNETDFRGHREANQYGLVLSADPYLSELTRSALKLGDGGASLCGGAPWPFAWMTLASSWRVDDEFVRECFYEFLETTLVRPVRAGA